MQNKLDCLLVDYVKDEQIESAFVLDASYDTERFEQQYNCEVVGYTTYSATQKQFDHLSKLSSADLLQVIYN